jgi:glycosyltransferase involved in cell wall biosynthesis
VAVARIIFLSPFSKNEITGGIKTTYRQAELLSELGFEACVYQPEGAPTWFDTRARVVTEPRLVTAHGDILVFPEVLNGILAEMVQTRSATKKVLFSQAHYYTLFNPIPAERYRELGFAKVACQGSIAKGFLERVLGFADVAIIPCYIDAELFFPRSKTMGIALIPRKLPREAAATQRIFGLKYPQFASIPWQVIENQTERETAEIFGRSTIVLSLPFLESFGLVPLEAMASGAIVAGFHGYGGQEYARPDNGFWFPPDHLEEVADALARIVTGLERQDPELLKIRDAGLATAARYSKERTRAALRTFYDELSK